MARPETTTVPRRLIDLLSGRYAFVSVLGRGGAGIVYEVKNIRLGRLEALKVLTNSLSEDTTRRFVQEARVCASLDHAGIVRVYDFGHLEGIHWYSMQLINGPSLAAIIDSGKQVRVEDFAKLSIPLMDALDYSHRNGVVHRDIKPANIMLLNSGQPCLTDFGIAKSADSLDFTQTSNVLGTPAYMSPEQADGTLVDGRSDQYSLAITFYRAITGRLPFSSVGPVETLVQRLKEDPEPIDWHCPDFPVPLKHVLMKALSRDREDRYPTIGSMKKSMLTACESCHIAWQEPYSLKGLEHLTAANRRPIEPGEVGMDEVMTQTSMTISMRNIKTRWWDVNRPMAVVALALVAAVVILTLFILFGFGRGHAGAQVQPAQQSQGHAVDGGTYDRQDRQDRTAPGDEPGGLRSISGKTVDAAAAEGKQTEQVVPQEVRQPERAPGAAKAAAEARQPESVAKRPFNNPMLRSSPELHLPPDIKRGLAEIGIDGLSLSLRVDKNGRVASFTVMTKLQRPLTPGEMRAIHDGLQSLSFDPATAEGGEAVDSAPYAIVVHF